MNVAIADPRLGKEEQEAVAEVLASGKLVQGEKVAAFEQQFAGFIGVPHAVAVSSGTAALQLGLQALGLGPGDEVITAPFTFIATANAILSVGATPVFADVEPETGNVDPAEVRKKITPKTKAVLSVHLYGLPCRIEELRKLCGQNILLIEDCAQSCGATVGGSQTGSFGELACFSFYATKNLCTGEGGMIVAKSAAVAELCRILRNQGQRQPYEHIAVGFNFRMTEMQAAIGTIQLKKLRKLNEQRAHNAALLTEGLQRVPFLSLPVVPPHTVHAWHQYTVRVRPPLRSSLRQHLEKNNIESRVYYPTPVYLQPAYRSRGFAPGLCPRAEVLAQSVLSLPVHPALSPEQIQKIITAVKGFRP